MTRREGEEKLRRCLQTKLRDGARRTKSKRETIVTPNQSQRKELRDWLIRIDGEIFWLNALYVPARDDHRFPCDPEVLADWLVTESRLTSGALEEKIRAFTDHAKWGALTPAENFYLRHRLNLANDVIEALLAGIAPKLLESIRRWPSNFEDQSGVRTWLLIDVWDALEETLLWGWAEKFLSNVTVDEAAGTFTLRWPSEE